MWPPCRIAGTAWEGAISLARRARERFSKGDMRDVAVYAHAIAACDRAGKVGVHAMRRAIPSLRPASLLARATRQRSARSRPTTVVFCRPCPINTVIARPNARSNARTPPPHRSQVSQAVTLYGEGCEDGVFSHWLQSEPFTLDLHNYSAPCAVRPRPWAVIGPPLAPRRLPLLARTPHPPLVSLIRQQCYCCHRCVVRHRQRHPHPQLSCARGMRVRVACVCTGQRGALRAGARARQLLAIRSEDCHWQRAAFTFAG